MFVPGTVFLSPAVAMRWDLRHAPFASDYGFADCRIIAFAGRARAAGTAKPRSGLFFQPEFRAVAFTGSEHDHHSRRHQPVLPPGSFGSVSDAAISECDSGERISRFGFHLWSTRLGHSCRATSGRYHRGVHCQIDDAIDARAGCINPASLPPLARTRHSNEERWKAGHSVC